MKMLLNDRQINEWINWFMEIYKNDCAVTSEWKMDIPIIYSEDPNKTEEEHIKMWRGKLKELMWKKYNQEYIHRGWRKDTLWEAQFNALRLFNGPIFKSITEKENETNGHWTTWLKEVWNVQWWKWEKQETTWTEKHEE